ncbi:O-antigen ligase family protein [Alloalcanivorax gelatiniphagus]|uniref:O-antigen ligase family protein n=1 Tax=Alloalcanivorax gelatiniphagus TaxID=1194167 RepID=A0ABY2XP00_9GAMM|nr:O-antigen ligase family protein [Alloalcanivorax gelatiniphagus]TMW13600.1 O-antigen ligase family protein [Alloalcanivorax gelatiniphagus]
MSLFASTILFVFPVALMLSPWSAGLVALLAGGWALVALRRPAGASPGGGLPVGFAAWLWALLAFGGHWLLDAGRGGAVPMAAHTLASLPYWPLAAAGLFLAWRRFPPAPEALWWGAALAAAVAGALLLYQWGGTVRVRVRTDMNAIPFGNLSLCFGVLALLGGLFPRRDPHRAALLALAGLLGLVASLLSGTRGGWVTLPAVALMLAAWRGGALWRGWRRLPVGWRLFGWAVLVGLAVFAAARVGPRVDDLLSDLRRFSAEGNTRTSVGLRLDMWRTAWALFLQKPWLGWGEQGLALELQRLILAGRLNEQAQYFGYQLHSDVLDTLARRGLLGLGTLLPLYLVPAWLLLRRLRGPHAVVAMAGLVTVVMFAGFGLTQSQLRDPYTLAAYLVLVSGTVAMVGQVGGGERRG